MGVRVVTVMCGSANTPIFNKPNGQLDLPEGSYYSGHGIEEVANKQRDDHQNSSMNVDELAHSLVKGILSGTKNPVWAGTYATLVRFGSWAYPRAFIDWSSNVGRGLELLKPGK